MNDEIPFTGRYNFNKDAFQNWVFCWGLSVNGAYCYIQDGQVVDFVQTDAYCDCLETLHRWYANGLIDVEAVTQDANTVMSKLKTGQVGCFFRGAVPANYMGEYANQYVPIMLPTAIEGVPPRRVPTCPARPRRVPDLHGCRARRGAHCCRLPLAGLRV